MKKIFLCLMVTSLFILPLSAQKTATKGTQKVPAVSTSIQKVNTKIPSGARISASQLSTVKVDFEKRRQAFYAYKMGYDTGYDVGLQKISTMLLPSEVFFKTDSQIAMTYQKSKINYANNPELRQEYQRGYNDGLKKAFYDTGYKDGLNGLKNTAAIPNIRPLAGGKVTKISQAQQIYINEYGRGYQDGQKESNARNAALLAGYNDGYIAKVPEPTSIPQKYNSHKQYYRSGWTSGYKKYEEDRDTAYGDGKTKGLEGTANLSTPVPPAYTAYTKEWKDGVSDGMNERDSKIKTAYDSGLAAGWGNGRSQSYQNKSSDYAPFSANYTEGFTEGKALMLYYGTTRSGQPTAKAQGYTNDGQNVGRYTDLEYKASDEWKAIPQEYQKYYIEPFYRGFTTGRNSRNSLKNDAKNAGGRYAYTQKPEDSKENFTEFESSWQAGYDSKIGAFNTDCGNAEIAGYNDGFAGNESKKSSYSNSRIAACYETGYNRGKEALTNKNDATTRGWNDGYNDAINQAASNPRCPSELTEFRSAYNTAYQEGYNYKSYEKSAFVAGKLEGITSESGIMGAIPSEYTEHYSDAYIDGFANGVKARNRDGYIRLNAGTVRDISTTPGYQNKYYELSTIVVSKDKVKTGTFNGISNVYHFKRPAGQTAPRPTNADSPITNISYIEAIMFCNVYRVDGDHYDPPYYMNIPLSGSYAQGYTMKKSTSYDDFQTLVYDNNVLSIPEMASYIHFSPSKFKFIDTRSNYNEIGSANFNLTAAPTQSYQSYPFRLPTRDEWKRVKNGGFEVNDLGNEYLTGHYFVDAAGTITSDVKLPIIPNASFRLARKEIMHIHYVNLCSRED